VCIPSSWANLRVHGCLRRLIIRFHSRPHCRPSSYLPRQVALFTSHTGQIPQSATQPIAETPQIQFETIPGQGLHNISSDVLDLLDLSFKPSQVIACVYCRGRGMARGLNFEEPLELVMSKEGFRIGGADQPVNSSSVDRWRWRSSYRVLDRAIRRWWSGKGRLVSIGATRTRGRTVLQYSSHFWSCVLRQPLPPETHGQPAKVVTDWVYPLGVIGGESQSE